MVGREEMEAARVWPAQAIKTPNLPATGWHKGTSPPGETGYAGPLARPLEWGRAQRGGGGYGQGLFIWQLVGVLATKEGYSATGTKVIPVFSGL